MKNKTFLTCIDHFAIVKSCVFFSKLCFFCQFFKMQTSLLAGALTLVIMNLPTIMRTTQESLKTVPQSYREGAFGLGAGKWRVIRTVVLPGCVDGVITGCILAVGRILGETAALDTVEKRKGKPFISVEEFANTCSKLSKTHIEQLKALGAFAGMADTRQVSLF